MNYLSSHQETSQQLRETSIRALLDSVSSHLRIHRSSVAFEILDYLLRHPEEDVTLDALTERKRDVGQSLKLAYPRQAILDGLRMLESRSARPLQGQHGDISLPFELRFFSKDGVTARLSMTMPFEDWKPAKVAGANRNYPPQQRPTVGTQVDRETYNPNLARILRNLLPSAPSSQPLSRAPEGVEW